MSRNKLGSVRRSQIISTHGPGAIIDFRSGNFGGAGVSVVAGGLEEWDQSAGPPGLGNGQVVYEPRLQKELGVQGFRLPPVAPQIAPGIYASGAVKLEAARFPKWLQCPKCHVLKYANKWNFDPGDPAFFCQPCSLAAGGKNRVHVVPVRFISICENGHLDEFPWNWWVGHTDNCSRKANLKLKGSATAGLSGLELSCTECGARRTMEGCFSKGATPKTCHGSRPWLGGDEVREECNAEPWIVQRGASNIYFSVTESALDIPPWSDLLQKKIGIHWNKIASLSSADERKTFFSSLDLVLGISTSMGKSEEEVLKLVEDRVARLQDGSRNLRWEEYKQFTQHTQPFGENTEFEIRPTIPPPELSSWISRVVRATRIREVRALKGFTRVLPYLPGDESRIAKLSVHRQNWLPAIENRGEGIFLELASDRVKTWESQELVQTRAAKLNQEYLMAWKERGRKGDPPRVITPRFLLIHSLAHALIRQLALTCGYNSSSLRERLYVGNNEWDMAGLLIYTSSPDADGTLGGLVRLGESKYLAGIFEETLLSMTWCSSDPLCIEGIQALSTPGSGAACHSCLLAAETSCEEFNHLLDRAMIVGTPANPEIGYFSDLIIDLKG